MKSPAAVPSTENDGKQYIKFDKVSGEKSQGTGWSYAVFCCLHRTTTSKEEKGDSISLHSPVSLLLYPLSPLSVKDTLTIRKFRKQGRTNTQLKDGFFCSHLLQSMDDYHSYCSSWFPFLLVLSNKYYCSYPSCLLATTALWNVSATSLYHLPGAAAYASQLSLLPKHASLQTQLWETRLRRAESLWLAPLHPSGSSFPTPGPTAPHEPPAKPQKTLPLWPDWSEKRWKELNRDGAMNSF